MPRASKLWQPVVNAYSRRELLDPGDKLPAIANLARAVNEITGETYVAGLWKESLVEGLMWQAVGFARGKTRDLRVYRAPSWSWASMDGPFGTFGKGKGVDAGVWVDLASVVECSVELEDDADLYGGVKDGWVVLRAPVEGLRSCDDELEGERKQVRKFRTGSGTEGTYVIFDTPERAEMARKMELSAVLLAKHKGVGRDRWGYHGIVVAGIEGRDGVRRRMGKVVFDDDSLGQCDWIDDEEKYVEVTLI